MSKKRIVSLCPSLTETLVDLGLSDSIVGCTSFCIYPKRFRTKEKIVGGTKNPNIQKIIDLRPTHVVVDLEENRKADIRELEIKGLNTINIHVDNINDQYKMFEDFEREFKIDTKNYCKQLDEILKKNQTIKEPSLNTLFLIWKDPWMSVNRNTFISNVMSCLNLDNVCANLDTKYPEINLNAVDYDLALLPNEPYHFTDQHLSLVPKSKLVNGEWFMWYGSRFLKEFPRLWEWRLSI